MRRPLRPHLHVTASAARAYEAAHLRNANNHRVIGVSGICIISGMSMSWRPENVGRSWGAATITVSNECDRRAASHRATPRQCLLGEYDECDNRHYGDVHDDKREQDDEQKPATAEAISTMQEAHAQRAGGTIAP